MKSLARYTGIGYLIIFVTGFYGNFYILENLWVRNDAVATLENLTADTTGLTMGILAFLAMVIIDFVLAFPLYKLTKETNNKMALISSVLRVINAFFFFVALYFLISIHPLFQSIELDVNQTLEAFESFNTIWTWGLLVFGTHLMLLGTLLYKSTLFPNILGILMVFSGIGYLIDSSAILFLADYESFKNVFEAIVISSGILGEFSFTLFLLIKGVKTHS